VPELGTLGSVRGDASNGIPYRDKVARAFGRSGEVQDLGMYGRSLIGNREIVLLVSMNHGFFVLLCAQLLEEVIGMIFSYATASTLWRRRSNPARPYMERLMTFSRLICPSTGPVLQGSVKAACTASRS
jgi:hypothetical protein